MDVLCELVSSSPCSSLSHKRSLSVSENDEIKRTPSKTEKSPDRSSVFLTSSPCKMISPTSLGPCNLPTVPTSFKLNNDECAIFQVNEEEKLRKSDIFDSINSDIAQYYINRQFDAVYIATKLQKAENIDSIIEEATNTILNLQFENANLRSALNETLTEVDNCYIKIAILKQKLIEKLSTDNSQHKASLSYGDLIARCEKQTKEILALREINKRILKEISDKHEQIANLERRISTFLDESRDLGNIPYDSTNESLFSHESVIMHGFLTKQGGKIKNWKKRLFTLNKKHLSYYKTDTPLNSISLELITNAKISKQTIDKVSHDVLQVFTPDRTYYLFGESPGEVYQWQTAILSLIPSLISQDRMNSTATMLFS